MPSKKSAAKEGSGQKKNTVPSIKRGRERAVEVMAVRALAAPRIPERARRALGPSACTGMFIEQLLRQGRIPDAILLSGGSNHIGIPLNHAASGLPVINAWEFSIGGVTANSPPFPGRPMPLLTHGHNWANELHPTPRGFATVTNKIAGAIAGL